MVIEILLDQGVPRDAARKLRDLGHQCIHVSEIGMWRATDEEILAFCSERNATIVTLDADFHAILAVSGASKPSVIRFRIQGLDADRLVQKLLPVMASFEASLLAGSLVTVKPLKTTCHTLPIGGSNPHRSE